MEDIGRQAAPNVPPLRWCCCCRGGGRSGGGGGHCGRSKLLVARRRTNRRQSTISANQFAHAVAQAQARRSTAPTLATPGSSRCRGGLLRQERCQSIRHPSRAASRRSTVPPGTPSAALGDSMSSVQRFYLSVREDYQDGLAGVERCWRLLPLWLKLFV
jgi:hypothetical protein